MSKTLYQNYRYNNQIPTMKFSGNTVNKAVFGNIVSQEIVESTSPEIDYSQEYLTLTSWEDNNDIMYSMYQVNKDVKWSIDKTNWYSLARTTSSTIITLTTINKGESVYIKGNNTSLGGNDHGYNVTFEASKKFEVSGNIMSILYDDNFLEQTTVSSGYTFINLFYSATNLLTARNLVLPCTTYARWIYQNFMAKCTSLYYAPKELPQQTSQDRNTLVWMFNECYNLQETPVIRLTTNASGDGWYQMFRNISRLKRVICLMSGSNLRVTGSNWLDSVSSSGTFYKLSTSSWQRANYACPSGWTQRDFDTLEAQGAFLSIWAETETQYDGIVAGCSDYFVAGDTVTLEYVPVNGQFNGYYDENGNLLSNNSTYTFTAQRSMKIKVKTT